MQWLNIEPVFLCDAHFVVLLLWQAAMKVGYAITATVSLGVTNVSKQEKMLVWSGTSYRALHMDYVILGTLPAQQ